HAQLCPHQMERATWPVLLHPSPGYSDTVPWITRVILQLLPANRQRHPTTTPPAEPMAEHARFHLVYDGPALVQHQMDVRALAPALLAMSDLVERANELLNGDNAKVSVNVNASFKSGSFGIDLELA